MRAVAVRTVFLVLSCQVADASQEFLGAKPTKIPRTGEGDPDAKPETTLLARAGEEPLAQWVASGLEPADIAKLSRWQAQAKDLDRIASELEPYCLRLRRNLNLKFGFTSRTVNKFDRRDKVEEALDRDGSLTAQILLQALGFEVTKDSAKETFMKEIYVPLVEKVLAQYDSLFESYPKWQGTPGEGAVKEKAKGIFVSLRLQQASPKQESSIWHTDARTQSEGARFAVPLFGAPTVAVPGRSKYASVGLRISENAQLVDPGKNEPSVMMQLDKDGKRFGENVALGGASGLLFHVGKHGALHRTPTMDEIEHYDDEARSSRRPATRFVIFVDRKV
eukprot:g8834.t1